MRPSCWTLRTYSYSNQFRPDMVLLKLFLTFIGQQLWFHNFSVIGREGGVRIQRKFGQMFFLHLDLDQNQYFYTEAPVLPQSRSGHTTQLAPPFKGYMDLLVPKMNWSLFWHQRSECTSTFILGVWWQKLWPSWCMWQMACWWCWRSSVNTWKFEEKVQAATFESNDCFAIPCHGCTSIRLFYNTRR